MTVNFAIDQQDIMTERPDLHMQIEANLATTTLCRLWMAQQTASTSQSLCTCQLSICLYGESAIAYKSFTTGGACAHWEELCASQTKQPVW